ncbi:methyltransferase domain-containing protein [Nannocystis pusilla]|uniref:Methyltransferase domain-containing protein n=1 Tax=Nannocystis pusilla TaxID=889268 RepID=A0ABS7TLG4_9BACT|nr:methyltransferase domain-containing protein [Nannocystis pusilla]MBZ5709069.1 methyltransferase domain-containing protein [Nannocystis pusilla]
MENEQPFSIRFHENDQEVALAGSLRPAGPEDFAPVRAHLDHAADAVRGVLYLNFKRLRYLNHTGFVELARFIAACAQRHPALKLKLVVSSVVPWAPLRFGFLGAQFGNTIVEQYDRAFYPGQGVIENDQLVPVLRTQTNIVWSHERELLRRHGLGKRMRIADICCGIGDFAVLVYKEFEPEYIVGVDHSRPFLQYAQQIAREFGITDIEYQFGDATHLFLPSNSFDFVTSRLALQIFNDPASILRELVRICKPGGRVYLTNEMTAHNYGYPRHESVTWTYQQAVKIAQSLGMDMNFGPKMFSQLTDMGLEDVRMEQLPITNNNTAIDDFARVIESWEEYVTGELSAATQQPPEVVERLRMGFRDHVYAIRSRRGFATWPIYVASGRKPER